MFNALSSNISIHFGLHGTNFVIASACASASSAIGMGMALIRQGWADVVLTGGAESPLTPVSFASWMSLRTLAQHAEPWRACRPFERNRNGMVLGEAAAMMVLESRAHADRRGAVPLAVVRGFGASSDAHHITAPSLAGQRTAIEAALADAEVTPAQIGYINAHGTATKANDETEARAVCEVFGARGPECPMSSTKSMLGHSLGATGGVEFIICVEAIRKGFLPPTINCDEPDPEVGLDYLPHVGRPWDVRFALSNSFAFGGNNVSLILEREP
jgi:3-oxoacyl-[acyl-carrier-protein] synthase II